jgi:Holliday junction resolvase
MNRPDDKSILMHKRLLKVATEYLERGYTVTLHPSSQQLPETLSRFALDLIAVNGSKTVAVEVRTRDNLTLNGEKDLQQMAELVRQVPGWELELVVTNPRKR